MLDKLDGRVPAQDGQQPLPPVQDPNFSQVNMNRNPILLFRIQTSPKKKYEQQPLPPVQCPNFSQVNMNSNLFLLFQSSPR